MDGINPIADRGWQMADCGGVKLPSAVRAPQAPGAESSEEQKKQVAKDFESVLLAKLFDQVQQSLGRWDLAEDGAAPQVQGLFWLYLAQDVAEKGGLGLWKEIYQHLPMMAGSPNPADVLNEEL
jgi:Rod binding domain-containing protein